MSVYSHLLGDAFMRLFIEPCRAQISTFEEEEEEEEGGGEPFLHVRP